MKGVTLVDHPLVAHKLTLMRTKRRTTKGFRQLLNEIGMLLCYEVTRDLPTELIDTPPTNLSNGGGLTSTAKMFDSFSRRNQSGANCS